MCRAAQVHNMEEALRRLDATRAALQEEYDAVFAAKVLSLLALQPTACLRSVLPCAHACELCPGTVECDEIVPMMHGVEF